MWMIMQKPENRSKVSQNETRLLLRFDIILESNHCYLASSYKEKESSAAFIVGNTQ